MEITIKPQTGFQEKFLRSKADIVIGGGKAGSGKTRALCVDPIRFMEKYKGRGGVIFRRVTTQIKNQGGLRDETEKIYPYLRGESRKSSLEWYRPNGNKMKFSHIEYESDVYSRQGSQIPFIGFDELTHFTEKQFRYLLSRNRSTCGVKPYIRATCNPDPDSRVKRLIEWWIDPDTGFIIKERDGVLRYFMRYNDELIRGDSKEELRETADMLYKDYGDDGIERDDLIKSITFIEGDIYENKELLSRDPAYLANLLALPEEEKIRLLDGNWNATMDDMALGDYGAIEDIFSNLGEFGDDRCITCDVARLGRDLTTVFTWKGWQCIRIDIRTKSLTTDTTSLIERNRELYRVGKTDCIVDEDGIGAGVVDEGKYIGFKAGNPVVEIRDGRSRMNEHYENLKTQCQYRLFERINDRGIKITTDNIRVDGARTTNVKILGKLYNVIDLIKKDLRSVKKVARKDDKEKFKVIPKEKQKAILGGRSPDFGDAIMMRVYKDLHKNKSYKDIIYLNV